MREVKSHGGSEGRRPEVQLVNRGPKNVRITSANRRRSQNRQPNIVAPFAPAAPESASMQLSGSRIGGAPVQEPPPAPSNIGLSGFTTTSTTGANSNRGLTQAQAAAKARIQQHNRKERDHRTTDELINELEAAQARQNIASLARREQQRVQEARVLAQNQRSSINDEIINSHQRNRN